MLEHTPPTLEDTTSFFAKELIKLLEDLEERFPKISMDGLYGDLSLELQSEMQDPTHGPKDLGSIYNEIKCRLNILLNNAPIIDEILFADFEEFLESRSRPPEVPEELISSFKKSVHEKALEVLRRETERKVLTRLIEFREIGLRDFPQFGLWNIRPFADTDISSLKDPQLKTDFQKETLLALVEDGEICLRDLCGRIKLQPEDIYLMGFSTDEISILLEHGLIKDPKKLVKLIAREDYYELIGLISAHLDNRENGMSLMLMEEAQD